MFIRSASIEDGWKRILNVIWYDGETVISERGKTKEILSFMVRVEKPFDRDISGFPMGKEELNVYAKQFLKKDKGDFEYTYGERLRAWGTEQVDQISDIIKRLKKSRRTRRATAVTWIPPVDLKKAEVPCLILVDFKIRNKELNLTAVFRSNDMFGAWPANLYALNKLNMYVAAKTNTKPGSITTLSISAHVYDHDFNNVKRILRI